MVLERLYFMAAICVCLEIVAGNLCLSCDQFDMLVATRKLIIKHDHVILTAYYQNW